MRREVIISILLASIVALSVLGVLLYSSPRQEKNEDVYKVINDCVDLCIKAKEENISLSRGPCLSDIFKGSWNHEGWVCDVAHYPREEIDNLEENQCKEYIEGKATNFVEVDTECRPIKVYYNGKLYSFR